MDPGSVRSDGPINTSYTSQVSDDAPISMNEILTPNMFGGRKTFKRSASIPADLLQDTTTADIGDTTTPTPAPYNPNGRTMSQGIGQGIGVASLVSTIDSLGNWPQRKPSLTPTSFDSRQGTLNSTGGLTIDRIESKSGRSEGGKGGTGSGSGSGVITGLSAITRQSARERSTSLEPLDLTLDRTSSYSSASGGGGGGGGGNGSIGSVSKLDSTLNNINMSNTATTTTRRPRADSDCSEGSLGNSLGSGVTFNINVGAGDSLFQLQVPSVSSSLEGSVDSEVQTPSGYLASDDVTSSDVSMPASGNNTNRSIAMSEATSVYEEATYLQGIEVTSPASLVRIDPRDRRNTPPIHLIHNNSRDTSSRDTNSRAATTKTTNGYYSSLGKT